MLNHVTIGVAELGRAIKFYDPLLGVIGAKELWSTQAMKMYGTAPDVPRVAICTPFNGEPQHPGNGTMIAFKGGSKEGVDQLYTKAIELGATDEGKPGERRHPRDSLRVPMIHEIVTPLQHIIQTAIGAHIMAGKTGIFNLSKGISKIDDAGPRIHV